VEDGATGFHFPPTCFTNTKERGGLAFNTDPNASGWAAARQKSALGPAEIVAQAKAMCVEFGFQSIKLKGGVFEPQQEVAAMVALREAFGPDVPLRIDPNALWTVETAIKYGQQPVPILSIVYATRPTIHCRRTDVVLRGCGQ